MADDDEQQDAASDPWASLESEGLPDLAGDFSFSSDDGAAADPDAVEASAGEAGDADIESWLDEPAGEAGVADGDSAVQIGTGASGVASPSSVGGFDEPAADTAPDADAEWGAGDAGSEWGSTDGADWASPDDAGAPAADSAEEPVTEPDGDDVADLDGQGGAEDTAAEAPELETESPFAAAATRPAAASRPRARPKRRKAGGIGQMIGVVLGGAMAIPITMAILIWGLQKDPFKVTKLAWVQEYGGFLLPEKFRPGAAKTPGPNPDASPLDRIAGVTASTDDQAAVLPEPHLPEPQPPEPDPVPPEPPQPEPPAVAVVPEPEPLDTSSLDRAVAGASTSLDAALAVDDAEDAARRKLLIKCYKGLAQTAEELARLERVAADSGRPLAATPEAVATLCERITSRPAVRDGLTGLAGAWLTYDKRASDGIFLELTFGRSRHVGPYWLTEAEMRDRDGTRNVTLISRDEPAAVRGDALLVIGLVMDDDVIWAADMRPAAGAGGRPDR